MDVNKQREILAILQKLKNDKDELLISNDNLKEENEKLIYQNKLLISKVKELKDIQSKIDEYEFTNNYGQTYQPTRRTAIDNSPNSNYNPEQNFNQDNYKQQKTKKKFVDKFDIFLIIVIFILVGVQLYIVLT